MLSSTGISNGNSGEPRLHSTSELEVGSVLIRASVVTDLALPHFVGVN